MPEDSLPTLADFIRAHPGFLGGATLVCAVPTDPAWTQMVAALSRQEWVLMSLQAALERQAAMPAGAVLARNATLPSRIPADGLVILRDGDPGEPEVTLSPLTWHFQHRAEIDVLVDRRPGEADAAFDALRRAIGLAVSEDRTLGGLCDWVEAQAPSPAMIALEGADGLKAATIGVVLHYSAADSLL